MRRLSVRTPSPVPLTGAHVPDLTPAPAVLRALAHVGEVDLAKGLGRRRLAELIRRVGPVSPPHRHWLVPATGLLILAAAALALLLR